MLIAIRALIFALFFSFSAEASPLLSSLPDHTQLIITQKIQVESSDQFESLYYHAHFDNQSVSSSGDVSQWGNALDSGVSIRAFYSDAIEYRFESDLLFDYERVVFLKNGRYCFSRKGSKFNSDHSSWTKPARDRLLFKNCHTGEAEFFLYVTAGARLRNLDGFVGLTVRDFQDQVGKAMRFVP